MLVTVQLNCFRVSVTHQGRRSLPTLTSAGISRQRAGKVFKYQNCISAAILVAKLGFNTFGQQNMNWNIISNLKPAALSASSSRRLPVHMLSLPCWGEARDSSQLRQENIRWRWWENVVWGVSRVKCPACHVRCNPPGTQYGLGHSY